MTRQLPIRFTTICLAIVSLALVVLAAFNFRDRSRYQVPTDGVTWIDSQGGVKAWIVTADGPGARAGILPGDVLEALDGSPVTHDSDAVKAIYQAGVWNQLVYTVQRGGEKLDLAVIIAPQSNQFSLHIFRDLVGLLYLFIGAFILLRRRTAPHSLHFYFFCLASFVLYSFSYTGELNTFDWLVYWLNVAALVAAPALFLHFCLGFPEAPPFLSGHRKAPYLVYLPGALLLGAHALVASGIVALPVPLITAQWIFDRTELIYLAVYFLAGAAALQYSYRKAERPVVKQQLKWLTRGAYSAILPFALLYVLPYFLGYLPSPWMKFSVLSLIILPLTFGYAIVRYRLMDVDVIFQRGIAYTLATLAIVGIYFGIIAIFADLFHNLVPFTGHGGWVLAIIVTAFVFQPLVNWIQARLDRFFNPERYDYRRTLLDLARNLTTELRVEPLLDQITHQLSGLLQVDRVAVLTSADGKGFRLARSHGIEPVGKLDTSFLDPASPELFKGYLFFDSVRKVYGHSPTAQRSIEHLGLHYYLPLRIKDQTLGYLGLGKTRHNDYLPSEDLDLLQTMAGYLSIALENARLYESLEQKALQYQSLRDFSESIIESINAGVLAFGPDGTIEAWNSAMENLYGSGRQQTVGRALHEVFPVEFLADLKPASNAQSYSIYKHPLRTASGRDLIVNLSVTPLLGKDGQAMGRLLVMQDLTERVNLENQLVQAEKLSSIGLLAAGVAHEVNTPLAVIASQAQMLMRQTSADSPQYTVIEKIVKQSFRASEIVNSLLKFSRLSGSEYSELDLNRIIHETKSLLEPMLRASRVRMNLQLAPQLPAVYGNAGKLQQVFINLILNARDAMPHGGEITVVTEPHGGLVSAEVCDTGVGIAPANLSKIFDPFFTTKSTGQGTGLGLAVTYGIIQEHSGRVTVDSKVGQGTTFHLEFPSARKPVNVSP